VPSILRVFIDKLRQFNRTPIWSTEKSLQHLAGFPAVVPVDQASRITTAQVPTLHSWPNSNPSLNLVLAHALLDHTAITETFRPDRSFGEPTRCPEILIERSERRCKTNRSCRKKLVRRRAHNSHPRTRTGLQPAWIGDLQTLRPESQ